MTVVKKDKFKRVNGSAVTVLSVVFGVMVTAAGCGGDDNSAEDASTNNAQVEAEECTNDADCGDGFCDRGSCAVASDGENFGVECTEASAFVCGAYRCTDGRCRSCESDSQCSNEVPDATCEAVEGRPGWGCGRYDLETGEELDPPASTTEVSDAP